MSYVPQFKKTSFGHIPEPQADACRECGRKSFTCPNCAREQVTVHALIDIFHVGTCTFCGLVDEPVAATT